MIEDFKNSFDDIGATTEHTERLLGASTEYTLGFGNTHSVHNIRSQPEWDKFWNGEKLPLVRRSGYVIYTLYLQNLPGQRLSLDQCVPIPQSWSQGGGSKYDGLRVRECGRR